MQCVLAEIIEQDFTALKETAINELVYWRLTHYLLRGSSPTASMLIIEAAICSRLQSGPSCVPDWSSARRLWTLRSSTEASPGGPPDADSEVNLGGDSVHLNC